MLRSDRHLLATFIGAAALSTVGCGSSDAPSPGPACTPQVTFLSATAGTDLKNRAYVASRDSGNIAVIDLDRLELAASVETCGRGYHMLELSADFSKAYASDTHSDRIDVLDTKSLDVTGHIPMHGEPTHLSLSRDAKYIGIVTEKDDAVAFVDPVRDVEVKRLTGFYLPHFVRYAPDGRYAYVANLAGYHVTRVDLTTLTIDGTVALDGFDDSSRTIMEEGGFADAQIDGDGVMWAAHRESGQTLVYDTKTQTKLPQRVAGDHPWIVYAEHPFTEVRSRAVPVWGNRSVALLGPAGADTASVRTEESESYGVNYSPLAPEKAFVMNRLREEIAVVDTATMTRQAVIPVGGNTETASTTADGKYIVAAVSGANRVVIIDARTNEVVKAFDDVGDYPWTVTIPLGQNYCH